MALVDAGTHTILVVDDSETTRKFLRLCLQNEHTLVLEASDGVAALELLARETPDLFVIDLVMPRMDGLTLIRHLRAMPGFAVTPMVMLTTETSAENRRNGYAAGVTVYLTKPIEPEKLQYKIQCLL